MTAISADLTIFNALRGAGVEDAAARAAVEAINQVIDARYQIHAKQLATQGDVEKVRVEVRDVRVEVEKLRGEVAKSIADTKSDTIKWVVGMALAGPALVAAIQKIV